MISRSKAAAFGNNGRLLAVWCCAIATETKLSHRLSFVGFQLPARPAKIAMTDSIVGRSEVLPIVEGGAIW